MNRWMVLRILVLGGGFAWAVWSLRDAPSVDLLADAPLVLTPPPDIPPPLPGDAMAVTDAVLTASQAADTCGLKGTLKVTVEKGLEKAEWRGGLVADNGCLEKALWGTAWPALPAPMVLEWTVGEKTAR